MTAQRLVSGFFVIFLFFAVQSCSRTEGKQPETTFQQIPEIQEIQPQKPVKIKLKRNTKGGYSWDISGDDADKILETDKKLKEGIREVK